MKLRRIRLLALGLVAGLLFTSCKGGGEGASTNGPGKNTLVVGMECNYAPYNWTQNDSSKGAVKIDGGAGFAGGYDVEIAKKIASSMGKELVVKQIAWEGLIPALENDAIDLIIAGMSETKERAQAVDFTAPYYDSSFVVLVKKGSSFEGAKSLADLKGAKMVGQKSTNYDAIIPQIEGAEHLTPLNTVPLIIHAIKNGAADGTVVEKSTGLSVIKSDSSIAMVEFPEGSGFKKDPNIVTSVSIAMKKGSGDLKAKVDEVLKGISNEEREKIMNTAVENQPEAN